MLTQIDLDDALITKAFHSVKVTSPTELLNLALRELIANRQRRRPEATKFHHYPLEKPIELFSLEEVIANIQKLPKPVANFQPASGLLAEHLRNCHEVPDPTFEVTVWNQMWNNLETQNPNL
jgi:hypothetical protein